jgi:16S rRNA (uracil1498-N3)-methyltransferase
MQLFFNPELEPHFSEFKFDKTESRHIVRVLRKQEGDVLFITNGRGFLFEAEIVVANDNKCMVRITKFTAREKGWNYRLHIAVAPTKLNDRMEWFLEKATEIGIDEITPIICHHSERKVIKLERFEKIVQAAMKQSLKCYLPKINPAKTFKEFLATESTGLKFIAHCEEQAKKSFKKELLPNTDVTILIGPEGDFSTKEIDFALQKKYLPVTLGESRLRTETAALVACHSVAFTNQID